MANLGRRIRMATDLTCLAEHCWIAATAGSLVNLQLLVEKYGAHRVLRCLVAGNQGPGMPPRANWTVLHTVAWNGREDCLKWLATLPGVDLEAVCGSPHIQNWTVLHCAAMSKTGKVLELTQWLLEHGGASMDAVAAGGDTIWDLLGLHLTDHVWGPSRHHLWSRAVTSLLRVMLLLGSPSSALVAQMKPTHARLAKEGMRLRAELPAYLHRRRALLDAHCPLIAPLRALVREYDPAPTTTEDIWATGLGKPLRKNKSRPRSEDRGTGPTLRRSARLGEKSCTKLAGPVHT